MALDEWSRWGTRAAGVRTFRTPGTGSGGARQPAQPPPHVEEGGEVVPVQAERQRGRRQRHAELMVELEGEVLLMMATLSGSVA